MMLPARRLRVRRASGRIQSGSRPSCPLPPLLLLLLMHTGMSDASPDVAAGPEAWSYLARVDPSLQPLRPPTSTPGGGGHVQVEVTVSTSSISVLVDGSPVYEAAGGDNPEMGHRWPHSGVHLVVLGPSQTAGRRLEVKASQRFITYQPAEHLDLATTLAHLPRPGRLLVLAAAPEWVMFLGRSGREALTRLGFRWAARACSGEAWAGVAVVGRGVVGEAATTTFPSQQYPANTLHLSLSIPLHALQEVRCGWEAQREEQARFCHRYDGYDDLCTCLDPFTADVRASQERLVMKEMIPVVVVTANKPRHLYRILKNLFTIPGGGQTEVLVVVDGWQEEAVALAGLLGVQLALHNPESHGNNRTNSNIRFALYTAFQRFPQADKVIVLEDDLILSPDLLSYFHQTAWILDNDPSVFCINAFNSNSLRNTSSDPTVLLRSESFPMYGWMVRRAFARQIINNWIPLGPGDWDWWLMKAWSQRGRDVVSPEVSRTLHAGSAGAHVDGFEQHLYYSRMIANGEPGVLLQPNRAVLATYVEELGRDLLRAELVALDPLAEHLVPEGRPGPFVSYVLAGTRNDEYHSFRVYLMWAKTYYYDLREVFRGVMRLRLNGRLLYLVGCPLSELFCLSPYRNVSTAIIYPPRELVREMERRNDKFEQSLYEYGSCVRQPTTHLHLEADLLNHKHLDLRLRRRRDSDSVMGTAP